jgi:Phosphotransferase enzyme family
VSRTPWAEAPNALRAAVASSLENLGLGKVDKASSIVGGFSPGVVERLTLDDGVEVFVKAASIEINPVTPTLHVGEARFLEQLPTDFPCARYLASIEVGPWGGLITEFIDGGNPTVPVSAATVDAMVSLVDHLASAESPDVHLPPKRANEWAGVREFARLDVDRAAVIQGSPLAQTLSVDAQAWLKKNLLAIIELEYGFGVASAGDHLLHNDLRTDNVVNSAIRGFVPVDWAWVSQGAPLFDLVAMLPSLHLDGAPPPWETISCSTIGQAAADEQLWPLVAGLFGEFLKWSLRPPPPGIPHVRIFQARQAAVCLDWLRVLMNDR